MRACRPRSSESPTAITPCCGRTLGIPPCILRRSAAFGRCEQVRYRALAAEAPDGLIWFWIGPHGEYERLLVMPSLEWRRKWHQTRDAIVEERERAKRESEALQQNALILWKELEKPHAER